MGMSECYCGSPSPDGWHLCREHADRLLDDLARIPETLRELDVEITMQAEKGRSVGGGSGEPSLGLDLGAAHLAYRIKTLRASIMFPLRGDWTPATAHQVAHLRLSEVTRREGVGKDAAQLHRVLIQAHRKIDVRPEVEQLGHCEDGGALLAPKGNEYAVCRKCGKAYPVDFLREQRSIRLMGSLKGRYMSGQQIADALSIMGFNVSQQVVSKWGRAGKLTASTEVVSTGGRPAKKYLVEDAVKLASELPGYGKV